MNAVIRRSPVAAGRHILPIGSKSQRFMPIGIRSIAMA
jgi:hypothetical protein